jgi:hypothetical protein
MAIKAQDKDLRLARLGHAARLASVIKEYSDTSYVYKGKMNLDVPTRTI